MSFLLKSVELSNIRSHEHIVFKPSEQGVTSILGKNGAGKSTIVDSIAWCLFGTKIGGVKNSAIMRSDATYKKGDFYAQVIIEVDGQELLVNRSFVTKGGAVEANVYSVSEEYYSQDSENITAVVDDDIDEEENSTDSSGLTHLAGPAVSHAENYIKQRLKMDEKGFLSSILVQQKEVDQLISASARERAKVIEDLTGITSITNALDEARKEYNALKKASTYSHADEEGIKEGEEKILEIQRGINVKKQEAEELTERLSALKTQGKELNEKLKRGKELASHRRELLSDIAILENNYVNKLSEKDELIEERNTRKESLGNNTSVENAKRVISERDNVQQEYTSSQAKVQTLLTEITTIKEKIVTAQEALEELSLNDRDNSEEKLKELKQKQDTLEKETENLSSKIISLKQSNKSFESAIEVLSKDDGECPTCLQKVSDPHDAVKQLENNVKDNNEDIERISEEIQAKQKESKDTSELISAYESHIENNKLIHDLEKELNDKTNALEVARGVERDYQEQLKSLSKRADDAANIVYKLEEYQRVLEKAQQASKDVNKIKMELDDKKAELKTTKEVSDETLQKAEDRLNKRRKQYQEASTKLATVEGEVSTLEERKRSEETMLKKLRDDFEKHKKLMDNLAVASSVVKITEEFRKVRIENSIPVIDNYASDFISRFTDNKFVKLSMDNKFNASVVLADGTKRPVSALSGGELSAAAIALRLAISMLLGGGGRSSMILDEVLVSMSVDRAENILYTIKDTAQGQVIMISHSDLTTEISDYVFDLDEQKETLIAEDK